MSFCVMRMAKIKSRADLTRQLQHNTRERMPTNADPVYTPANWTSGGTVADIMAEYGRKLPAKVRKNAVHAVELVMTASQDFAGGWSKYLFDCQKWAKDLFGEGNLLHAAIHKDEETPHVHMIFIPLKDGKLNAKHYIGGSRDRMSGLQDEFWEKAGRPHGLERGVPRKETQARHNPHTLTIKANDIDKKTKEFEAVAGMSIADVKKGADLLEVIYQTTPDEFEGLAQKMRKEGAKTYKEHREIGERKEKQQQQKRVFSR